MENPPVITTQNTTRKDLVPVSWEDESLSAWLQAYLQLEVTTMESSRKVQRRDLELFLSFMTRETGGDRRRNWTPRLSQAFKSSLRKQISEDGARYWNDRTVNRILAHLKTFTKWVNKHRPFPLGDPMARIRAIAEASLLEVERAITPTERRKILDAADLLLHIGGRSRDRKRYRNTEKRPQRKDYRPWRNRAIVYALIETGMRRAAVTAINLTDVDFKRRTIRTEEKGGTVHTYLISQEGLKAIRDYLEHERAEDEEQFQSTALFMPTKNTPNRSGRLNPDSVNRIWNEVCGAAGVKGKTPHSARHAMGKHIIDKTGNVAAVQRQLGHKNAGYSLQYARISSKELGEVLDSRE